MKCDSCHRNIPAGVAAAKMIVEYLQPDGSIKTFGYMMPDGRLTEATGRILRGFHSKCWWIKKKRAARGDLTTVPSGYDIEAILLSPAEIQALGLTVEEAVARGAHLSAHVEQLHTIARQVGLPIGDPTVTEAYQAHRHGGPYPHTHTSALEPYQLRAHLTYAHGLDHPRQHVTGGLRGWRQVHAELHARHALAATPAARHADPGHVEATPTDWRTQTVADVNEITAREHQP